MINTRLLMKQTNTKKINLVQNLPFEDYKKIPEHSILYVCANPVLIFSHNQTKDQLGNPFPYQQG